MANYTSDNSAHIGTVVFLDGVEQLDCIEADTDNGYVVSAKRNDDGNPFPYGDGAATEKRFGVVTAYPSTPRLSPDGISNICDQCGDEWRPGQGPDCGPCRDAWAQMDAKG